ncbi:MAG TPA: hypothetical protein VKW04_03690 [Planctomycetota bacterium]|nr:hypothetical protein [Planctomycetota bacterium]
MLNRLSLAFVALLIPPARAGLELWDTGKPSTDPLPIAALEAKAGWTKVGAESGPIKGDAVLSNGRITVVVRKAGSADLYSPTAPRARVILETADGKTVPKFEKIVLSENSKGVIALEVSGPSATATLKLKKGDPALETSPGPGAGRLRVETSSRFAVFPDFFADDIVVDAAKIPAASIEAPSENFLLNLGGRNDSIVMSVFENRDQDVRLTLSGDGERRAFTGSEIQFGKSGKVWVSLLEGPGIWHTAALERSQRGRVVPLGWKMPYPAYWRVDFTNSFDLFDSWDMLLLEKEGGEYLRPTWFGEPLQKVRSSRQMFDAAIGGMTYPAFADAQGNGFVQGFNEKGRMEITHVGPLVVYPINRLPSTPLDVFTVVDIVRNTMGVGPCEHIFDVEGQKQLLKGRATCSVRDELNSMYQAKEQKARKDDAEQFLKQGEVFVAHIRSRINGYADYAHKMLEFLAAKKKEHPELASSLAPLEKLLGEIDASIASKMDHIKMPEDHAKLFAEFRKSWLGNDGPDALEGCKKWTDALVDVGGTQDELVAHCRWVVKNVRQKAGLLMVQDATVAPVAAAVRAKAQEVLRAPSVHESARH